MKTMLCIIAGAFALASCVFESPFADTARFAADQELLGKWETTVTGTGGTKTREQMLVLQHSANEYTVAYPAGDKAMMFRAYEVELAGGRYLQLQLIGTARDGPVKTADRKYHLLKAVRAGDKLEIRLIDPDKLGIRAGDTAALQAAFAKHRDDPDLFNEPQAFKKLK